MDSPNQHLAALQAGHEQGLQYYMRLHGAALRYFAFRIVKSKPLAEEIVSDSYVKLWQGKERVVSESSLKAFLYISTKNACLDQTALLRNKASYSLDMLDELLSPNEDMLTKMIQLELIKLIVEEVDKLPTQQALVFRMTYLEQKETEEICQELGTTASSIYFARSKALAAIKKTFGFKRNLNFQELTFLMLLLSTFAKNN